MTEKPKTLYCYKENDVQKWVMSNRENDKETFLNILMNDDVDKASLFGVPAETLMFGVMWLWKDAHHNDSGSIWNFFEEYNRPQMNIKQYEKAEKLANDIKKEEDFKHNSLFGFISPAGKYFHCDYQGHISLAHDICFGQFDTDNPERYLEEHGWCKIYSPVDKHHKYAVYVGGKYVITKEQMDTLIQLGLDNAKDIQHMLVKD